MLSVSKVTFHYADRKLKLRQKRVVKNYVSEIFYSEGKVLQQLSYIFCSDDYLLRINRQFLRHDYYTDIITFNLSSGSGIIGEIYVSIDRVLENAVALGVAFQQECLRVIFHGALHLSGYSDKKKSEITIMRAREDYYLRLFEQKLNGCIS